MIVNVSDSRRGDFSSTPPIIEIARSYNIQIYNNQYLKIVYSHFITRHINDKKQNIYCVQYYFY